MSSATLDLAQQLIRLRSITPEDAGCQDHIAQRLKPLGFVLESMRCGEVTNLGARRGRANPVLCFAGHTDVVPTGPLDQWFSDPFEPSVREGRLYGRGAADMKSSIAAFVCAAEEFVAAHPQHSGSIALLLTSDEEGVAVDATVRVLELGPVNASIHKLNEHIELDALDALTSIYRQVLERLLLPA
jgi:succinyl-diaminopimelate desuccinylase